MRRLQSRQSDNSVANQRQAGRQYQARRTGSLMVEMVVSAVILSTVAAILAPAIHGVKRQRIATKFESMALIEMTNVATLLKASPGESVDGRELSEWFSGRYPGAGLEIEVLPTKPADLLQPIKITVSRMAFNGEVKVNRSLVTWITKETNE